MDKIFHTKVLCFNEKEENLTGKSEYIWIECAVDLTAIIAVKKDIRDDKMMTSIYFAHGDYFVIGAGYEAFVMRWMKAKGDT